MKYMLLALMLMPAAGWAADAGTVKCTLKSKNSICQQRIEEARETCTSEGVVGQENIEVCALAKVGPKGVKVERMTKLGGGQ